MNPYPDSNTRIIDIMNAGSKNSILGLHILSTWGAGYYISHPNAEKNSTPTA